MDSRWHPPGKASTVWSRPRARATCAVQVRLGCAVGGNVPVSELP